MNEIQLKTTKVNEFINITLEIREIIEESGVSDGICIIFIPHTTAGLTIMEGVDPDVARDVVMALERQFPWEDGALHLKEGYTANAKAVVVGASETVAVKDGKLHTGSWQQIFFCEFNGPRRRKVFVKVIADAEKDDAIKFFSTDFELKTSEDNEFINIMTEVRQKIKESGINDGFCLVSSPGTSAGITLNDMDPGVLRGINSELEKMVPAEEESRSSQIKAAMVGNSETVIIENGEMLPGKNQKILFYEMSDPRTRTVTVTLMGK